MGVAAKPRKWITRTPRRRAARAASATDRQLGDSGRGGPHQLLPAIDFRYHPSFDDPEASTRILEEDLVAEAEHREPRDARVRVPRHDCSRDISMLCKTPLLPKPLESRLFQQMNFLKFLASRALAVRKSPQAEGNLVRARRIRDLLIHANSRLVVSLSARYANARFTFEEMFSEGMLGLLQAVEKFDFGTGNCFSTYATTAIRNNLHHLMKRRTRDRHRVIDADVMETLGRASTPNSSPAAHAQLYASLMALVAKLDPSERRVVEERFGLSSNNKPMTLKQIADEMGLSRERVRQIQLASLRKLHSMARDVRLEAFLPESSA